MNEAKRPGGAAVFSALPLLLGLSGPALAGHGQATVQVYNAVGILNAGGAFSVSGGLNATYVADAGLEKGSDLTLGLPQGFTFASAPALVLKETVHGIQGSVSGIVVSGGVGANYVTYRLTGAVRPDDQLLLLGAGAAFVVENGLTLAQPSGQPLAITFQASGNSAATRNDPVPVTVPAFRSTPGVELTAQTQDNAIALTNSPNPTLTFLASQFVVSGRTTTSAAYLGSIGFHADGVVLNADASPFTLGPADASTLTVRGTFRHISAAYLDPANGVCGSSPPSGAIVGAVGLTALTFASVQAQQVYGLCMVADGVHVLSESPAGSIRFTLAGNARFGATQFVDPSEIRYSGGVVTPRLTFITGSDAGYSSLVSVTNQSSASASIFVEAEPFTGGPPLPGLLGTLAPGAGTVYTEAQIGAATGLSLANSGQRAVIQIIGVGSDDLTASSLLVSPGGVVDNVR